MKEWIRANLLTKTGAFNGNKLRESWFIKHGHEDKLRSILNTHKNLKYACRILLGKGKKCKSCSNIVLEPRVFCSCKCAQSNKEVRDRLKTTMVKNHGVSCALQSDKIRAKSKKTLIDRYGVEFYSKSLEYKEKIRSTSFIRYGTEHYLQSPVVKDKIAATLTERYGGHHSKSNAFKEKIEKTNLDRYGVPHAFQLPRFQEKQRATMLSRHGVRFTLESDVFVSQIKATCLDRYGFDHPLKSEEVKAKVVASKKMKYGPNWSEYLNRRHYSPNLLQEIDNGLPSITGPTDAIFKNISTASTYTLIKKYRSDLNVNTSSMVEQEIRNYIKEGYGFDVISNTRRVIKPLELDIWIPELNLAFEFNGTYWHSKDKIDRFYHQRKSMLAKEKGIRLIHLYEFNDNNLEIVKKAIEGSLDYQIEEKDGLVFSNLDFGSNVNLGISIGLEDPELVNGVYNSGREVFNGRKFIRKA